MQKMVLMLTLGTRLPFQKGLAGAAVDMEARRPGLIPEEARRTE